MRFLTVADRELRAAARRKATYRVRWVTALVFFALLVWLLWVFDGFTRRGAATDIFGSYSVLSFIYCIIVGTGVTADSLSAERRDGTLGLLFLTNLKSAEIVAGKFCSLGLTALYGLAAIFPMLALPLLMGGITLAHFWKTVLALVVTTFFSMSAGFVASVFCRRQFLTIACALGMALSFGPGLMGAAAAAQAIWRSNRWADELAAFSPLYSLISASGTAPFGVNHYWFSILAVSGVAAAWLALVTLRLGRTWRDRARGSRAIRAATTQRGRSPDDRRVALRRRLLNINPFFWLGGRRAISSPAFMAAGVVLVAAGTLVAAPYFSRTLAPGMAAGPVMGHAFAWLWTGLAVHAITAYFAAMAASQRLAEDKQAGALELILSTPTSERTISQGLWLAYARRMLFPVLLATLVHLFFVWQFLTAILMETPQWSGDSSQWQVFWRAVLGLHTRADLNHWQLDVALRCLLLVLALFMLTWVTLGWVGRWLGLRMKHPGFAPVVSLALLFVPPTILFSAACYVADVIGFDQWPERQFFASMMWLGFAIGVAHCLLLANWARGHLRRDFRTEAMSRYQPLLPVPWGRIIWLMARRLAIGAGVLVGGTTLIVLLFYGYQNWRGQRQWAAFARQLQQSGQSLDFTRPLPTSVSDDLNFARSPAFEAMLARTDALARLPENLHIQYMYYPGAPVWNAPLAWYDRKFLRLEETAALLTPAAPPGRRRMPALPYNRQPIADSDRPNAARGIRESLEPFDGQMKELSLSAKRPFFQIDTNGSAFEFLDTRRPQLEALERLQRIFIIRACAALEMKRTEMAAEDLSTSLRLAGLARQSIDARSTQRAQAMLTASLQPLWEGIVRHQWNDAQLAAVQEQLAGFDFLSDYTNAVRRATLAYIEWWQAMAEGKGSHPPNAPNYAATPTRDWQPRAWWLNQCIQLHQASQNAITKMDVAAGRVDLQEDADDVNGLPLDSDTQVLFQQPAWQGASPAMVSFAQTAVNQAIIACALERHFIAHGHYPETLEALQPAFSGRIPNDPVRGRRMSYERKSERDYVLYSAGPNGIDDRNNPAGDDWLWSFPTNAPSAK